MSYSLKQGETVSLNTLVSRNTKFVPPMPTYAPSVSSAPQRAVEDLPERLLKGARKDAHRNNLNALWYVIRHAA